MLPGDQMLYIVTNEFDEITRLVQADSPEQAITRAKAHITPQALQQAREAHVQSLYLTKKTWAQIKNWEEERKLRSKAQGITYQPPESHIDPDSIHPEEEGMTLQLDDFDWEVTQIIDPDQIVTELHDLYY